MVKPVKCNIKEMLLSDVYFVLTQCKYAYFVTDNPVSLRLGTDISLHSYNKMSCSDIGKTSSID